jgi:ABC-type nitrate/sulfonate/bicarbonate transport system substrate-binding protein
MNRSQLIAIGTAAGASALLPRPLRAADPVEVKVSFFPGASAWPMYMGIENGIFARAGLAITLVPTPNSADLFAKLDSGAYDIAHTSADNPFAYDMAAAAPTVNHDFVSFFGVDDGMQRLVAKKGTPNIAALRGKTVAVDAMTTGYAFALREALSVNEVNYNDCTWVSAGGTAQRYLSLIQGKFDVTLITPPYDYQANEQGFVTLGKVTDFIGAYQGISGVARRAWLIANRATAIAYVRAYRAALTYVAQNRAEAIALFLKHNDGLSQKAAAQSYEAAFRKGIGFRRDAAINLKGMQTIMELRAKYAPPGAGTDPLPYMETSILTASA